MNKKKYITNYVTNFLSTWAANNPETACEKQPLDDAIYMATESWVRMIDFLELEENSIFEEFYDFIDLE